MYKNDGKNVLALEYNQWNIVRKIDRARKSKYKGNVTSCVVFVGFNIIISITKVLKCKNQMQSVEQILIIRILLLCKYVVHWEIISF